MKLSHTLLLALVLGVVVGYFAEPSVAPILQALVQKEAKPAPTRDEWDDLADKNRPSDEPEPEEPKPEEPKPEEPKPEEDDAFVDGEEDAEEEDPEGTAPRKMMRYVAEDDGMSPVAEEQFKGKLTGANWRQPAMLERRLASQLRQALKKIDQKGVAEFLKKPENRLMLAQWELLHLSDMDALSKLMKDRETAEDLALLLNDLPWVSSFVYDGQLVKPEIALAMVRHFRQNDPNMDKDVLHEGGSALENVGNTKPGLKRRIAAAVAVQFTRNGWYGEGRELTPEEIEELKILGNMGEPRRKGKKEKVDFFKDARERYQFFAESADQELLHSGFASLPDWLMHIVCGWKGNSPFGSATTMRWLRDNCAAPAMRYTGMAFQVPYLPLNVTGDVIFSAQYYEPFQSQYPGNFAKMTRDVGAVCGGLSHFGTSSACANGVPAVTMGEPGHCAYAVYVDGKWHPSNTVSEDRHPHWSCWGEYSWSAFEMMTSMFQNGARTRDAQMVATMGSVLAAHKNPINALKLFELSATMQPLNQPIWALYMETASKSLRRQPRKWLGVNEFICSSVAPQHPAMCATFLTENIYPSMLATLRAPRQKIAAFEALFTNFNVNEKAEWDIDKLLDMQYASLGRSRTLKKEFFEKLFDSVSKHPSFSLAVAWAIRTAYAENKNFGKDVLKMVEKAMETTTDRDAMVAGIIRGAEAVGNIELATQYSEPYIKKKEAEMKPLPKFEPVGGNLVSEGGLVKLSKYHPDFRSAIYHGAALTTAGGLIQSDGGKHQTVTLELKKAATLGGIVIIPTGGSAAGYYEWNIEVSKDGKEWTHLAKLPNKVAEPCVRVNIKKNNPTVKFIRIDSGEGQLIGINFRALLVYDNKKVH